MSFDWSNKKVYVAGHRGLVGSALVRALERAGAGEVIGWRSSELDLRDRDATYARLLLQKARVLSALERHREAARVLEALEAEVLDGLDQAPRMHSGH